MRFVRLSAFTLIFSLFACQPINTLPFVTVIDNGKIITLQTEERVPSAVLSQAGITLNPNDCVLLNGLSIDINQPITKNPITLQVRRAVTITIKTPEGEHKLQSSAFTVGEALQEASISLHAGDKIEPPLNSLVSGSPLTIYQLPSRALTVTSNGKPIRIETSAQTVGAALAEAGIPLIGLDYSLPAENEPIPFDGQIRLVRVSEAVLLAQKPIPFDNDFQASADVPLDQTQILQPGETGLIVQRIRIRYEDGKEISRLAEAETMVRPPKTRIMAYGTKVEVKTATVDGINIEYWRAVQMYATSYSPCRSGGEQCYSGTSSGKSLRKGMVGLRYSWYLSMQGQQLYIPGYGFASVEDVCGGCTGKPWIDLGFSDSDFEAWHSWVTVYFLTPVPPNVIYDLQ
ncbi:MAG TPA: ubiquitin-like domain-containing protein [Anaerolineales bacterium]|nr:ubiquitin-like domain-containing protein [Anaerolineales bacterium]